MPEINGIAHIQLSVTNMKRSKAFYAGLLPAMAFSSAERTRNCGI